MLRKLQVFISFVLFVICSNINIVPAEAESIKKEVRNSRAKVDETVVIPPTQMLAAKAEATAIRPSHVTIYSDKSALVCEKFDISFKKGINKLVFSSVPESILTGSFFLKFSPDDKDIHILERSYDEKSKKLHFLVKSPDNISRKCELYYLVKDIRWRIFYVATLSTNLRSIDLNGWIQLDNDSGKNFKKVRVDLVSSAGIQNKASPKELEATQTLIAPESVDYPYHLYEPIELKNHSNKHISWAQAQGIKLVKDLRIQIPLKHLEKWEDDTRIIPVQTWVSFANTSKSYSNFSRAMPPGFMTVYQQKAKGGAHIVGTSRIDHTPAHGIIEFRVPSESTFQFGVNNNDSTSIESELQQTSFRKISKNIYEASYKLVVNNPTDNKIKVNIFIQVPKDDKWELSRETIKHEQIKSNKIVWNMTLLAKKREELQYRIRVYKRN